MLLLLDLEVHNKQKQGDNTHITHTHTRKSKVSYALALLPNMPPYVILYHPCGRITLSEQQPQIQRQVLPAQCSSPAPCSGPFHTAPAAAAGHLAGTALAAGQPHPGLRPQLWPGQCRVLPDLPEAPATLVSSPAARPAMISKRT